MMRSWAAALQQVWCVPSAGSTTDVNQFIELLKRACRSALGAPPWSWQRDGPAAKASSNKTSCSIQSPEERGIARRRALQDM